MNKKHLVISTIGDPFLASTWSGTPHNIAKALTEIGIEISGIDASIKSQNVNRLYRVFGSDPQVVKRVKLLQCMNCSRV